MNLDDVKTVAIIGDTHDMIPEWAYLSILILIPAPFGSMLANKLVHPEVKE